MKSGYQLAQQIMNKVKSLFAEKTYPVWRLDPCTSEAKKVMERKDKMN